MPVTAGRASGETPQALSTAYQTVFDSATHGGTPDGFTIKNISSAQDGGSEDILYVRANGFHSWGSATTDTFPLFPGDEVTLVSKSGSTKKINSIELKGASTDARAVWHVTID